MSRRRRRPLRPPNLLLLLPRHHPIRHNWTMKDLHDKMEELIEIAREFGLDEVSYSCEDWSCKFSNDFVEVQEAAPKSAPSRLAKPVAPANADGQQSGVPVNSPTTGIYYSSPNPGSPPFVKIGDSVEAGQVIGLIEAMKVFNEITATVSGKVVGTPAANGQLVQPGDPLVYIGQ